MIEIVLAIFDAVAARGKWFLAFGGGGAS